MSQTNKRKITAEDLWELEFVGDPQVSPDGKRVAFVVTVPSKEKNGYTSAVWTVPVGQGGLPAGEARQFTLGRGKDGPCRDNSPRWSPDGSKLAFLSDRAGKPAIWVMDMTGGEARQLTNHGEGVGEPVWSPDGRHIAFVSRVPKTAEEKDADAKRPKDVVVVKTLRYKFNGVGFVDPRPRQIWTVDVQTEKITQVTRGEYNVMGPAWSPCGRRIAFASARFPDWELRAVSDIWAVDVASGEMTQLTRTKGPASNPAWSPCGKWVAYYGNEKGDISSLNNEVMVAAADGSGEVRSVSGKWDRNVPGGLGSDTRMDGGGATPAWSADGAHIYFVTADGGQSFVFRVGLADGKVERVTEPVACANSYDLQPKACDGGPMIAFHGAGMLEIGEIYAVCPGTGKPPVRLTGFNDDLLGRLELSVPERVTFPGTGGVEIEGWLMKPLGFEEGKKYPVVLEMHGGPAATYGNSFFHEFQLLCAAGIGVLFTNPQGSQGYGERFCNILDGDWGGIDYSDFMLACDYAVANHPWVDANRLGLAGGSYGGFTTNWIVSQTTRFAAAVTMRSISSSTLRSQDRTSVSEQPPAHGRGGPVDGRGFSDVAVAHPVRAQRAHAHPHHPLRAGPPLPDGAGRAVVYLAQAARQLPGGVRPLRRREPRAFACR